MSEPPKRDRAIHPRLPDDLHAALVAYATANDRSLQSAVVHLLRCGLRDVPVVVDGSPNPVHLR